MEIETIKWAYEQWQKADAEWIDRTLELAAALAIAKNEHPDTSEFSYWLGKNGIKMGHTQRAAFIGIGGDLVEARKVLNSSKTRSPELIWKELRKRVPNVRKSDSSKSKKHPKKATRDTEFAPKLLAAIRRKRKEAHDVRINRKWTPEALNKIMLHDLLNAVEQFLEDFINHRKMSLDIIEAVKRDPRAAERSIDYVTQDKRGTREFDA